MKNRKTRKELQTDESHSDWLKYLNDDERHLVYTYLKLLFLVQLSSLWNQT